MPHNSRDIVQNAWRAFAGHDADQISAVFTDDAEWLAPPGNATAVALHAPSHMVGKDAIVHFLAEDFPRFFVRDVNVTFHGFYADGERVIVEETMTATLANGHHYANDYCFVFELRDGLIHRVREYMDTARGHRMVFGEGDALDRSATIRLRVGSSMCNPNVAHRTVEMKEPLMSEDRIERETLIAAPLERVWSLVAEPGFWVADEASLTGTVAEEGESIVAKNAEYGDFPVRVEKVEPPTYVAYRWVSAFPGEELREDNSTLVEFTLTEEGDKTRLRVVESGFAALAGSEELRRQAVKDNTGGWPQVLDAFKKRAEQSSA